MAVDALKLSIVTTLYYSAPYLQTFYERVKQVAQSISNELEFILVNDGSPDKVLEIALDLYEQDSRVIVVDLSRNFGQHKAIMTGLQYATGDHIFLLDCDLEIAPENLRLFYDRLQAEDADAVYGVQINRGDPLFNRIFGAAYYRIFNALSAVEIPQNLLIARLMSARYVKALLQHQEQVFIIAALWAHTGFKQVPIEIEKHYKGSSTYNLRRKVTMLVNSIVAFSNKPLIYISVFGLFITSGAFLYLVWLMFSYFFLGYGISGWNSLIVSIWLLGGINTFILGIIALYLSIIFLETKPRPYSIVRQVYQKERVYEKDS